MQHHSAGSTAPGVVPRVRLAALALLALHLTVVSWLVLRPLPVVWVPPGNMTPFATIADDLAAGPREAVRTLSGGMLPLSPLGLLLPLLGHRLGGTRFGSLGRTVFAGGMIALALEYGQSWVPSRVADIDSVILSTAGIALAHQLGYRCLRRHALDDGERGWDRGEQPVDPPFPHPGTPPVAHRVASPRCPATPATDRAQGRHDTYSAPLTRMAA
ncbi:VanZ family protein [Streptomyces sp. RFCAC02]|uniref:VanZ family protein n=1 Tax=Streptomyces sp. RFCAC02 TaxID=2499143 RepID=UPI00143DC6A3|nr:VanZ family protein [Streptomyces sp. RFCAC02]